MAAELVIRGGNVVTPGGVVEADVAVEGGVIVEVGPGLAGGREEIDARGQHVFPGVIDSHVHFNEPGRTEWEGFDTGSAALAAGGGTTFFEMPLNASPPTLDGESFDLKLAAAMRNARTDFALWGGLTPANLDRMEELAERGVVGFKAFMSNSGISDFPAADDYTLYKGMQKAAELGLIVAVHAENDVITSLSAQEAIRAGRRSWNDYLESRPVVAEVEAIRRAASIAEATRCRLHIVHVSSAAGSEAAHDARTRADVSYETCPHYLLLGERDLGELGAAAKCAPPLRGETDRRALWEKFYFDRIDFVASDHSPAPATMKTGDDAFAVWGGIAGVQSTLSTMLTVEPEIGLAAVARFTAGNVAQRFGLERKGRIAVGHDADLAIVDLDHEFVLTNEMLLDRHKLSPYVGRKFCGLVRRTLVRGHAVFADGRAASGFRGKLLKPRRG